MIFRLQPDEQVVEIPFTLLEDDFLEGPERVSFQLTSAVSTPGLSILPPSTVVEISDNEGTYI